VKWQPVWPPSDEQPKDRPLGRDMSELHHHLLGCNSRKNFHWAQRNPHPCSAPAEGQHRRVLWRFQLCFPGCRSISVPGHPAGAHGRSRSPSSAWLSPAIWSLSGAFTSQPAQTLTSFTPPARAWNVTCRQERVGREDYFCLWRAQHRDSPTEEGWAANSRPNGFAGTCGLPASKLSSASDPAKAGVGDFQLDEDTYGDWLLLSKVFISHRVPHLLAY